MIRPNTVLQSRYLVLEQIGQGGMGAVYKATDQRFGSTVALKETFFHDPSLRKAFEREAHLLNRLRHPALPRVSDHFLEDEGQFLVMEYIPGADLSEMMEQRDGAAFPLEQVLGWADQLLDALDYLHTHEPPVIHRDIKPQNLKLTSRNQIVLLDFGLAKGTPITVTRASAAGSVFGYSRNYAPLEQMQGTGTDTRSDLYSLAATLYHLMTGAVPPDAITRAMATVNGQPDPLRRADEAHAQVTHSVAAAISKAMSQSAAARFQTAEEMREALREAARLIPEERASNATVIGGAQPSGPSLQDQATQLMGAQTSARPPGGATRADAPGATSAQPRGASDQGGAADATRVHEAATLLGPGAQPSAARQAQAEDASVVTRVSPAHSAAALAAPAPRGRGLTYGAAAAVLLLVVAGAFYAYTRRASVSTPPPAEQPAPLAASTPEPQPSAQQTPADVQVQEPAVAADAAVTPEAPQAPQAAARAAATPRGARRPAEEEEPEEEEPEMPDVRIDPATQAEIDRALREAGLPRTPPQGGHPPALTPEQQERLRQLPRHIRRVLIDQQRMRVMQQRELERERVRRERERVRREQHQPAPAPAPQPPSQ